MLLNIVVEMNTLKTRNIPKPTRENATFAFLQNSTGNLFFYIFTYSQICFNFGWLVNNWIYLVGNKF